jgi:hypothetical protein
MYHTIPVCRFRRHRPSVKQACVVVIFVFERVSLPILLIAFIVQSAHQSAQEEGPYGSDCDELVSDS